MTDKDNEAIWIYQHLGIELKINVSKRSISALKRFIEVLEYNPDDNLSLEDYVILEDLPQDERQPTQPSPEKTYGVPAPILQVLSPPQKDTNPPSARDQTDLIPKEGSKQEIVPDANLASNFIPKFEWDRTKEKSYRTIFFYEHEDGRVMIFYLNSRVFTTKAVVLALPYPIPRNYSPLHSLDNNRRTAFRLYREYLAKEAASHELVRWKDKNNEDILLYEAENKDEDEIMSDAAKEAEEKRLVKLRQAADVNKSRWKDRVENEVSARTKALRESVLHILP